MGIVEDTAEGIGEGLGAVAGEIIAGLLTAIPPLIREILPALIEGMKEGLSILTDEIKANLQGFTAYATFLLVLYFSFIAVRTSLMAPN